MDIAKAIDRMVDNNGKILEFLKTSVYTKMATRVDVVNGEKCVILTDEFAGVLVRIDEASHCMDSLAALLIHTDRLIDKIGEKKND